MALGQISQEQFKRRQQNYKHLLGTIGITNLPNMMSLAASSRLQNAIKDCTQVRKMDPAGKE